MSLLHQNRLQIILGEYATGQASALNEPWLQSRAQDSNDVVVSRMAKASDEMSHWAEYDYVLVNDDLENSVEVVADILKIERLKRDRQPGLADFVNRLRDGR